MKERHKLNIRPGLRRFDVWLREVGRTSTTGYRWRQRGWIRVLNVGGRSYVTDDEIERFILRGKNGEFFRRTLEKTTTASIKSRIKESFKKGN